MLTICGKKRIILSIRKKVEFKGFFMSKIKSLLLLAAFALPLAGQGATAPVILNVNYTCADPAIHIGSQIVVYASAVEASQTIPVSVTAYTSSDITLGGAGLS